MLNKASLDEAFDDELYYVLMQSAGIDKAKYNLGHNNLNKIGGLSHIVSKRGGLTNDALIEFHKLSESDLKLNMDKINEFYTVYYEVTVVAMELCLLSAKVFTITNHRGVEFALIVDRAEKILLFE